MKALRALGLRLLNLFSSLGLSCVLLVLLGLLTWLGTLEQVHDGLFQVQKKYFESFFLVHHAGPIPIPLPGANLVLCLLAVNLLVGGMLRLRRSWSMAGIMIGHVGIALILLSSFVKLYFSEDGHVTLFEGQSAHTFQSYHRWELAILEDVGGGRIREYLVPQEDFAFADGTRSVTLTSPDIPFDIEVSRFLSNCRPQQKGPMFEVDVPVVDGIYLDPQPRLERNESNIAGAYVRVLDPASDEKLDGILWGVEAQPWTVSTGGKNWGLRLRHERYPMPFTIVLDKFTKKDHPRSNMPKMFSSDVTVIENDSSRPVKISMNEPLRDRGLVLYQASWGPSSAGPGDPLFSTLSVVRNPADQMPLYSCIVILCGFLLHFSRKLRRYIRSEVRAR